MNILDPENTELRGINLIEASAGTGKTHAIASLFLRLILERELKVDEILTVTFTQAATAELHERIRKRLREEVKQIQKKTNELQLAEIQAQPNTLLENIQRALQCFDQASIFTIHGFCNRVLRENAFETRVMFDCDLVPNQKDLLRDVVADFWAQEVYEAPKEFLDFLEKRKVTFDSLVSLTEKVVSRPEQTILPQSLKSIDDDSQDAQVVSFKRRLIEYAWAKLNLRKNELHSLSFGDLLHYLARALDGPRGNALAESICGKYKAVLIDEFQDTDHIQYHIFQRIFRNTNTPVFLIGDPKQSIYAFRGADIFAYFQAASATHTKTYTMDTNWRSDTLLVHALNTLFARNATQGVSPFIHNEIQFFPVHARSCAKNVLQINGKPASPFHIQFIPRKEHAGKKGFITKDWSNRHLPDIVASDIVRLLRNKVTLDKVCLCPSDIAVLVNTNAQAHSIYDSLCSRGVPCVIISSDNVFSSQEASELALVLQAILDPTHSGKIKSALATDLIGLTGNEILALDQDEQAWEKWVLRFHFWLSQWRTHGFIQTFKSIMEFRTRADAYATPARLLALERGLRRLTNLRHLGELLYTASVKNHLGIAGLMRWFSRERALAKQESAYAQSSDFAELRLESDEKAVRVVTIHKSKGLEYPVVYCPYLWETRVKKMPIAFFHDPQDCNALKLDIGTKEIEKHKKQAKIESFAESLRVAYVALTRAKHLCVVYFGAFTDYESSALGYLFNHPCLSANLDMIEKKIKKLSDDCLRENLDALQKASGGTIKISDFVPCTDKKYIPPSKTYTKLGCPTVYRKFEHPYRTSSFSELTHSTALTTPHKIENISVEKDSSKPVTENTNLVTLHDFPRGARAGMCFHSIFERLDFTCTHRNEIEQIVGDALSEYNFDVHEWRDTVCKAVDEVLGCTFCTNNAEQSLKNILSTNRMCELEFMFPVADQVSTAKQMLVPKTLAQVFSKYASMLPKKYIDHLVLLDFPPLRGFLKGFIDLVFVHKGQWYIVDYKSNFLGKYIDNYALPCITQVMAEHDYFLQYHLYTVALHRYLKYRIPEYDYTTHFGGIYYLFIRGMLPEFGPKYGVFYDYPPKALIEALSKVFCDLSFSTISSS